MLLTSKSSPLNASNGNERVLHTSQNKDRYLNDLTESCEAVEDQSGSLRSSIPHLLRLRRLSLEAPLAKLREKH